MDREGLQVDVDRLINKLIADKQSKDVKFT